MVGALSLRFIHSLDLIFFCRNESFVFAASSRTPKLYIWVHDHKTIGKDKAIGEGEVEVNCLSCILIDNLIDDNDIFLLDLATP